MKEILLAGDTNRFWAANSWIQLSVMLFPSLFPARDVHCGSTACNIGSVEYRILLASLSLCFWGPQEVPQTLRPLNP